MDFKSYFQQPYQGGESFIENVIIPIFGENKFDDGYEEDIIEGHPELETVARATGITQILRLGTINIPMNPTDVFDITVSDRVQMERNRVAIQQLVRRIMSTYSSAFMIFHYDDDDKWDWRFSYSSKQSSNKDTTESKRYTFLLGPNQSCRTAAENFDKLAAKGGRIERDDIIAAFDVEALSKEFFGKYKAQYEKFCDFVYENKTDREWFGPEFEQWEDKQIRDYVKRLLGRIVFLHFLQKKGWMGVPADKAWGEGRQQFMKDLFDQATPAQQANYLDEVLEPMFIDLDTLRDNDIAGAWCNHLLPYGGRQGGGLKVPYLNGGLFEKDEMDEPKSVFPAEYFRDLFTFFYQYNFTIDENDPDDAQVGVDPEMLGRIFENLLEDNKDKGAFYTPKEIVQYMCRESLIAYLQTDLTDEATREALRLFVTSYDAAVLGGASSALAAQVSEQLKAVKICDPAIGSGAFPMGLLRELFLCRSAIEGFERAQASAIKRHIIQQNIYGVDIEKGAVDIARLRFWLTLILDEETPHALPNLDFKIMQGNSLLEQYQGIDLTLVAKTKNERRKHILGDMQLTWFEADIDVTRNQLKEMMKEYYGCKDHARRSTLRDAMAANVKSQIQSLNGALDLSKINVAANSDFFLWHTWFADVFEEGGFDIVIGNPPYGAKLSEYEKQVCKRIYKSAKTADGLKGSSDTFAIFIEQGLNLLQEGRSLCLIVPLSVTSSDAMGQLHEIIKESCETIRVSSYSNRPVQIFESAGLRVAILLCTKTNTHLEHLYTTKLVRRRATDSLFDIVNNLKFVNSIDYLLRGRFPKVGSISECQILKVLFDTHKNLQSYLSNDGSSIFYRAAGGRYFNVITDYSTHTSAEKSVKVKYARQIGLCLSSTVFWFYQQVYTDGLNLKSYEIESFPLPDFTCVPPKILEQMDELYTIYLHDIESKANVRVSSGKSSYNVSQFKEYKIVRSLDIVRQIDEVVCPLYGLSNEQTDYIKNYEIEYRKVGE